MPIEIRYFRNSSIENNGLTCLELGTSQTTTSDKRSMYDVNTGTYVWGIRVWKRASDGTETEITSGTPVAQVSRSSGEGLQSNTWACPNLILASGDSIVVRVYICKTGSWPRPWTLLDTWQTSDFNAGELIAATWTIYYYTKWWYGAGPDGWDYWGDFYFGSSSYNSRIENFTWIQYSQMFGPAASLRIYKQGASATPKSVDVTFTLKDTDDNPLGGKTIEFTVSLGCSRAPTSAVTDGNGQATTTVTSGSTIGWAVVKGYYAGLSGAGESETYVEIAVYDEAPSGDASKDYQVFIQGMSKLFRDGSYRKTVDLEAQEFWIELPEVDTTVEGAFEVIIYRRGIQDFIGRVRKPKRTLEYRMLLTGRSNHWKLVRRVANKSYTNKDPKEIIEDMLTRYPAGVSKGAINTYGTAITRAFSYDTLLAAIRKLLDITGWKARLNLDDSLDFASDFGSVKSVTFVRGTNQAQLEREIDYEPLDTRTFLIGEPATLVCDKDDPTAEAEYGLVEQAFFDKNATTQAVLDSENQKILDSRRAPVERITGKVIDLQYAADAYDVFDTVTVTDPNATGLSGTYRVVALTRSLKDCGSAEIELSNLSLASEDLLSQVARIVKDLSV